MDALTWVPLSDLHLKKDFDFNCTVVLEALWEDISKRSTRISPELKHIDLIFFTGDLVYHGEFEEK